jgi:outer membrane usher protein
MNSWRRGTTIVWMLGIMASSAIRADDGDNDPSSSVLSPQAAASALANADRMQGVILYLEVIVNGEPTNKIVSFVQRQGHLLAQQSDLRGLGFNLEAAGHLANDSELIDLATLPGLRYRYLSNQQKVEMSLSDAIRAPHALGRNGQSGVHATSGTGLVFNYDAYAATDPQALHESSLALSSEQRLFSPYGVLDNTELTTLTHGMQHQERLSTTYRYDNPDALTSLDIGDNITSSLAWTRSVRFGGVQYRRDFTLAPDLVTFPLPQLTGSAAVPSTVDLYVNNVRQMTSDVPSGPFVINGAATITGGGVATVVVRDAMGRQISASLPIYVDSRLLARGLSSYSMEAGFLRYNFGLHSNDYQGHAAASGTWRYGLNNIATLEAHAEATDDLGAAGAGALVRVGNFGVLRGALSGSSGPGRGGEQGTLGYQIILPRISVTAQTTRAFHRYSDLAAIDATPPPSFQDQVSVSVPLPKERSLGASFVRVSDSIAGYSKIGAAWYSVRVSHAVSAYLNVSRDFEHARSLTAYLGVSVDLGSRLTSFSSVGEENGHPAYGSSLYRSADYQGGLEWSAQANRVNGQTIGAGRLGYLGQDGEIIASAQDNAGHTNVSLEGTGSVVWMDGALEPARRVGEAFALVSTDGLANVPVMHENQLIGHTDGSGHLLVTDLNAYQHNAIGIDSMQLPADTKVPITAVDAAPRSQSGVLAHFPISHYVAASITLVDDNQLPLPVGARVHVLETGEDFVVGYDGQAFIEDLQPENHLVVDAPNYQCAAQFNYKRDDNQSGLIGNLGSVRCRSKGVHQL